MPSNVYRFAIANVADARALAEFLRASGSRRTIAYLGLDGTISPGALGFTNRWGIEPTVTVEIAARPSGANAVFSRVAEWLRAAGETCAYFTTDGARPGLLYHAPREGDRETNYDVARGFWRVEWL